MLRRFHGTVRARNEISPAIRQTSYVRISASEGSLKVQLRILEYDAILLRRANPFLGEFSKRHLDEAKNSSNFRLSVRTISM